MKFEFYKYQGAGNDFVIIDNRSNVFDRSRIDVVKHLCDRRFGIGADGLMLLQNKAGYDFEMVYYNADGNESSMCGNGGRCIVAFAKAIGVINNTTHFIAVDGDHDAEMLADGSVKLKMADVLDIEMIGNAMYLNTGSPHYVDFVDDLKNYNGFAAKGTNVNFVEKQEDGIFVRTYERGVEAETLACGTGVTAAALAANTAKVTLNNNVCNITTLGGKLKVYYEQCGKGYKNIWLQGPAVKVFSGEIEL
jgi:diaminopimelate epimerase